jgi:hypothetical protein
LIKTLDTREDAALIHNGIEKFESLTVTELQNKCTHLAQQYLKDFNGLELYQDYKDIIISLKRAKQNGGKLNFSPEGLLKYISSVGLGAYKTLATAFQIMLTLPVSVA